MLRPMKSEEKILNQEKFKSQREQVIKEMFDTETVFLYDMATLKRYLSLLLLTSLGFEDRQLISTFHLAVSGMIAQPLLQKFMRNTSSHTPIPLENLINEDFAKGDQFYKNCLIAARLHELVSNILKRLSKEGNTEIRETLSNIKLKDSRNLSLDDYLVKPIQRICKYPLLIRELIKNTNEENQRALIEKAFNKISEEANNTNESMRYSHPTHTLINILITKANQDMTDLIASLKKIEGIPVNELIKKIEQIYLDKKIGTLDKFNNMIRLLKENKPVLKALDCDYIEKYTAIKTAFQKNMNNSKSLGELLTRFESEISALNSLLGRASFKEQAKKYRGFIEFLEKEKRFYFECAKSTNKDSQLAIIWINQKTLEYLNSLPLKTMNQLSKPLPATPTTPRKWERRPVQQVSRKNSLPTSFPATPLSVPNKSVDTSGLAPRLAERAQTLHFPKKVSVPPVRISQQSLLAPPAKASTSEIPLRNHNKENGSTSYRK